MKRIISLTLVLAISILFTGPVVAQTTNPTRTPTKAATTPTAAPTQEEEIDTIEKIKDLVASKVAELNLVEKRGIYGSVKEVKNTQVTIEDHNKGIRVIDIDELTKFEGDDEEDFGISDIQPGDNLSFVGLYNKDTKRLLARFISKVNVPLNFDGLVVEKDVKEFTVTIVTQKGEKKVLDIQTSTKMSLYDEGESVKSGFTKIEEGQRLIGIGFENLKDKEIINASRIIHFTSIPASPEMKKFKDVVTEEVKPSTGSAGKVAPIIKEN